jgi:hypothetical protein
MVLADIDRLCPKCYLFPVILAREFLLSLAEMQKTKDFEGFPP